MVRARSGDDDPRQPERTLITRAHGLGGAFGPDIVAYRDLLRGLVARDLALRYRQTLLGPAWILLQPLLSAGVFTFLLGSVAHVALPVGVPYFVFALAGLAVWTGFSQSLLRGTNTFLVNVNLVSRIYFPRIFLPLSAAIAALIDCAIMLVIAVVALLIAGIDPTWRLAAAPVIAVLCVLFGFALTAVLAVLLVRFRDITYALPTVLQALLFVTPVLYPITAVPRHVRTVVEANPLTFVFEALRWSMFGTHAPSTGLTLYAISAMVALTFGFLALYSVLERDIADII